MAGARRSADSRWHAAARGGGRAVALLSGGLDSGVAAALWRAAGGTIALALTAHYGQRAAEREQAAAGALAARWAVPWRSVDLRWLAAPGQQAGSALFGGALPRPAPAVVGDAATARAVWVPARNLVLCAVAAAFAEAAGAGFVLAGFNAEEAQTFPDNSPQFVRAFDRALAYGCQQPVALAVPTLDLDKMAIVAAASRLGLQASDFWSCYADGPLPCGTCESCRRSARAWAAGKT